MSKKTKSEDKVAAILTIKNAADMAPKGRRAVAEWLHEKADALIYRGNDFSPTWRARYLHE
jgi:hypothetical protein